MTETETLTIFLEMRPRRDVGTCTYLLTYLPTVEKVAADTPHIIGVLPPPDQRCGTAGLNSFGNRASPSDNSNDQ